MINTQSGRNAQSEVWDVIVRYSELWHIKIKARVVKFLTLSQEVGLSWVFSTRKRSACDVNVYIQ